VIIAMLVAPGASATTAHVTGVVPASATRPVPASLREFCASAHVSCKGHWTPIGGKSVYELDTAFALKGNGEAIPLATGCIDSSCTVSNVGGGKCWSDNSQTGNGIKVVLNNCDPNSYGQAWGVVTGYGGAGLSWVAFFNNECLNDPSGSNSNGTQQQIWSCYYTTYEDYGYEAVGSYDEIAVDAENPANGSSACLSDDGNSSSGAPLVTESCNGSNNQRWFWAGN
jgi:hypothetical protein